VGKTRKPGVVNDLVGRPFGVAKANPVDAVSRGSMVVKRTWLTFASRFPTNRHRLLGRPNTLLKYYSPGITPFRSTQTHPISTGREASEGYIPG
jgi:hypothetical protein